jgi:hypothetical protein
MVAVGITIEAASGSFPGEIAGGGKLSGSFQFDLCSPKGHFASEPVKTGGSQGSWPTRAFWTANWRRKDPPNSVLGAVPVLSLIVISFPFTPSFCRFLPSYRWFLAIFAALKSVHQDQAVKQKLYHRFFKLIQIEPESL